MKYITTTTDSPLFYITLNRPDKYNAFNPEMLKEIQQALKQAEQDLNTKVVILNANGPHFSTGADISWMQAMTDASEEANLQDAMILADTLSALYNCIKPTICAVQGKAMGGGSGLIAACDIALAAHDAKFCFSEVKLGLIPAVISPYIIQALGPRITTQLFMTAQDFNVEYAQQIGLINSIHNSPSLLKNAQLLANQISNNAPLAVQAIKPLVRLVQNNPIDDKLKKITAESIARTRVSAEAQRGLRAFLAKQKPSWD